MKPSFLFFAAFLLLILLHSCLFAQQVVLSAGAEATGSSGSVSWSVGQIAFIPMTSPDGSVNPGAQQPYEILFNGIYDQGISLESSASPNPVTSVLKLKITSPISAKLSYRLCNLNGMVIREEGITGNETMIPMEELQAGTYLLNVSENNVAVNFYKIIKK